ncbi:MAG: CRISPR-associated protein Csx16 [Magnetococcus sp. WYHC-3]
MTIYLVTRHAGALQWAADQGIAADVLTDHLDPECVQGGDWVLGSMPVNLAARICQRGGRYFHLRLELTRELRGAELTAEQMRACGAVLEEYHVQMPLEGEEATWAGC